MGDGWNYVADAPSYVNLPSADSNKENDEYFFERMLGSYVLKQEVLSPTSDPLAEQDPDLCQFDLENGYEIRDETLQPLPQNMETRHRRRSSSVPAMKKKTSKTRKEQVELSNALQNMKLLEQRYEHNTLIKVSESAVKLNSNRSVISKCNSKDSLYTSTVSLDLHSKRHQPSSLQIQPTQRKYVSTAEMLRQFEKETPKRFHTVSSKTDATVLLREIAKKAQLDKKVSAPPKTPNLTTRHRARPVTAIGFEMREQIEFEDMKKYKWKSKPFRKDLLKRRLGPEVQKRPTTKPDPFKLTVVKPKEITTMSENFVFTARSVPRHVISGQGVVARVPKRQISLPVTPMVLKHKTTHSRSNQALNKNIDQDCSAKDVILKTTVVQPFSFDSKLADIEKRKEERLNKILEDERLCREFHSKPMPKFRIPQKHKQPPTPVAPKTPNFASKDLVLEKQQKFKAKMREEAMALLKAAEFKAKPCSVIYKRPFQPEICERPIIETEEFNLHSESRARQREIFSEQLKIKEAERLAQLRELEIQSKVKEERETEIFRKKATYKAQPIKKFAPVVVAQSSRGATIPESPMIASRQRNLGKKGDKEN